MDTKINRKSILNFTFLKSKMSSGSGSSVSPSKSSVSSFSSISPLSLHSFVKKNQITKIKNFVGNVNEIDENHRTALHFAMFKNTPEIAEILLKKGANPDTRNRYNIKPYQIKIGHPDEVIFVKCFIENGLNANSFYHPDVNFLTYFLVKKNLEMVEYLIKKGAVVECEFEIFMDSLNGHPDEFDLLKAITSTGVNQIYVLENLSKLPKKATEWFIKRNWDFEEKLSFIYGCRWNFSEKVMKKYPEELKHFTEKNPKVLTISEKNYINHKYTEYITPKKIAIGKIFQEKKCGIVITGKIITYLYGGDETDNMRLMLENT